MPKINVYLPDELAEAVKQVGVPVSAVCQRALELAVRRVTAIRDAVLGDLDLASQLTQLTARAQSAVTLGITRAREDGAAAVSTGHLLAGMLGEGANLGIRVLQAVEIEPQRLGRELAQHELTETPAGEDSALHFSTPAATALELAVTEATALGHNYIGCEHLLLGLIAEPDGVAGQVLRSAGADLRSLRRAVTAALAGLMHTRSQPATAQPDIAAAVTAAIQPLVERIERLEERAAR